jgi:ABC-type branched-subunit amino acid transport system substrate-binding protein
MAIKRAFTLRILMLLSVLALLISGCASASTTSSGGLKTDKGISDLGNGLKLINLGVLTPLSGPVAAPIGIPLTNGIDAYFKYVNDNGGIGGYKVNLLLNDTQYNPQIQVQKYNDIHDHVLMIAESLGTPTTFAIKDQAAQDHMLVSAATLASSLAREKYLVLVGTPYRLQTENAFDYVVNKLGKSAPKTGLIYQNDEYGQDGQTGYKESIDAYHLTDVGQKSYNATDTDFSAQVGAMKTAGAEYVFLSTTPSITAKIIGTAAAASYFPQWILQSPAWSVGLLKVPTLAPLLDGKVWVVGQGAAWGDTTKPGMAEMLQNQQKYYPNQAPDGYFEFGYAEAKITAAVLKKAYDNGDLTRDGVFKAFESLQQVDLGGLYPPVTYGSSPDQRVPTRDSTIYQVDSQSPAGVKEIAPDFTGTAAKASKF